MGRYSSLLRSFLALPVTVLALGALVLPHGATAYTGTVEDISPFELDAAACDPGYVGPDCDVLGDHDWGTVLDPELAYGPGMLTIPEGNVFYSGIRFNRGIATDGAEGGILGHCVIRPFTETDDTVSDASTFQDGVNYTQNPWPIPDSINVPNGTDFCYTYTASEWSSVPDGSGGWQNHLLLYGAFDRNTNASGAFAFTVPFWTPTNINRNTDVPPGTTLYNLDFDVKNTGLVAGVRLRQWLPQPTVSKPDEGTWLDVTGADLTPQEIVCVGSDAAIFFECIVDLTALGLIIKHDCIEQIDLDGIVSRSSNAINSQLKDFAPVNMPPISSSCGEIIVNKTTEPPIAPGTGNDVEFGYQFLQADMFPTHENTPPDAASAETGTLTVDGDPVVASPPAHGAPPNDYPPSDIPCNPLITTPSPSGCNFIVDGGMVDLPTADLTDHWTNVIGQQDYMFLESWSRASTGGAAPLPTPDPWAVPNGSNYTQDPDWPVASGENPTSVFCTFTDMFEVWPQDATTCPDCGLDSVTDWLTGDGNEPRKTVQTEALGILDQSPTAYMAIQPSPFLGTKPDGSPIIPSPTVCDILNTSTTIPVTLSSFQASRGGGGVQFDWTTQTEAGNLGYYLYVQDGEGEDGKPVWRQLDSVKSQDGDSMSPRSYSHVVEDAEGETFAIADVDNAGKALMHGPFTLGKVHGKADIELRKIDWKSNNIKHKAKKLERQQQRMQKMKQVRENQGKPKKEPKQLKVKKTSARDSLWGRALSGVLSLMVSPAYAAKPVADAEVVAAELTAPDNTEMRIEVNQTGIYRVTFTELGLTSDVVPSTIALTNRGNPVPITVSVATTGGEGKGKNKTPVVVDTAASFVEFVGEALDDLYTGANVYVLHLDASKAARTTEVSDRLSGTSATFYMETVRVEEEKFYADAAPNGDPWYARQMMAWGGTHTTEVMIDVNNYLVGVADVTVDVGMWGVTNLRIVPDHHVQLSLNGTQFADEEFDGLIDHPVSATVSNLLDGANTLTLHLPLDTGGTYDRVHLDSWAVTYPRSFVARDGVLNFSAAGEQFRVDGLPGDSVVVYRVLDSGVVEKITSISVESDGSGYSVTFQGMDEPADYYVAADASLLSAIVAASPPFEDITTATSDYLVIAHPDFLQPSTAMDQLVALREASHSVKVVDVDQVYTQFGHGIRGAQPIADYIAYAEANMGTTIVHLVGGTTSDPMNYLQKPEVDRSIDFIPTLYGQTSLTVLFAPIDSKYADVDGDDIQDVAIGRTPARNYDEFAILVDKIAAYEENGSVAYKSVFAADKMDLFANYDFKVDANAMIDLMPEPWRDSVQRIFLDDYIEDSARSAADARSDLTTAINGGVALTSFSGHSSLYEWTWDYLLTTSDARGLGNLDAPTLVTQWGCYNTYYVQPEENTLAHELMLNHGGGAAAVLGASGLTKASHERQLGIEVYSRLFDDVPIGTAVLEAKRALADSVGPGYVGMLDVMLGWQLLGDPGMRMRP